MKKIKLYDDYFDADVDAGPGEDMPKSANEEEA